MFVAGLHSCFGNSYFESYGLEIPIIQIQIQNYQIILEKWYAELEKLNRNTWKLI